MNTPTSHKTQHQTRHPLVARLLDWTTSTSHTILFDTDISGEDVFRFRDAMALVRRTALVFVTAENNVFGAYLTVQKPSHSGLWETDPNHFLFSFQSHGACTTPTRWHQRSPTSTTAIFFPTNPIWYIQFGAGHLRINCSAEPGFCIKGNDIYIAFEDTFLSKKPKKLRVVRALVVALGHN